MNLYKKSIIIITTCVILALISTYFYVDYENKVYEDFNAGKFETSIPIIEDKANKNDHFAQEYLSVAYYYGLGVEKDYQKSYDLLQLAIKEDSSYSNYMLAKFHGLGIIVDKDEAKAKDLIIKSANKGYSEAQYFLGTLYLEGIPDILEKDTKKAKYWLEKAANSNNNINAQYLLGYKLLKGDEFEQDYKQAFKYLSKVADTGYSNALYLLGDIYSKGLGVNQDNKKAEESYNNACGEKDKKSCYASLFDESFKEDFE